MARRAASQQQTAATLGAMVDCLSANPSYELAALVATVDFNKTFFGEQNEQNIKNSLTC